MVLQMERPTYGNRYLEAGSRSANLFDRAQEALPGGNSRTTVYQAPYPVYAARGEGCRVIDADGQARVDYLNNYTSLIHGHAHPAINQAVTEQLTLGTAFGFPTESEIKLAELLSNRVKTMERIRFTNSGSESVMMAVHAARGHTGRSKIAKFEGCYHGSYDIAAISVGPNPNTWGDPEAPNSAPDSAGVGATIPGEVLVLPMNNRAACEKLIAKNANQLAAVIIDPLPNGSGCTPFDPAFVQWLRDFTRQHDILMIADEVISFRIDYHGAQHVYGIDPDITTLAKIMGGGFPVGAVGGKANVMGVFDPRGGRPAVGHGGTFNANPITMVAGYVAMDLMTRGEYERIGHLGDIVRDGLTEVFTRRNYPAQATGHGSLFKIVHTDRKLTDYRSQYLNEAERRRAGEFHLRLLGAGYILGSGSLGCISTPMTEAESRGLVTAVDRIISEM